MFHLEFPKYFSHKLSHAVPTAMLWYGQKCLCLTSKATANIVPLKLTGAFGSQIPGMSWGKSTAVPKCWLCIPDSLPCDWHSIFISPISLYIWVNFQGHSKTSVFSKLTSTIPRRDLKWVHYLIFSNPRVVVFSVNRAHSHCLHFSNVNTRRALKVGSKIMYQLQALELLCLSSIQILRLLSWVTFVWSSISLSVKWWYYILWL